LSFASSDAIKSPCKGERRSSRLSEHLSVGTRAHWPRFAGQNQALLARKRIEMFGDAVIPIPLAIRIVEESIATHAAGNFGAKRNPHPLI
jgi:hypothetical protein